MRYWVSQESQATCFIPLLELEHIDKYILYLCCFCRVGQHEAANKMPFHNLAVVFGPTLLKPANKAGPTSQLDLFSSGANDAMYQSGILFYYLTLLSKGIQFR